MASSKNPSVSTVEIGYITAVVVGGFATVALGIAHFVANPPPTDLYWLGLLTLISGVLPVRLPKVAANISVSETFVFFGTLLFGPYAGALLGFLDVGLIWARLASQKVFWHRMVFSMAANPLSIFLAANVLFWIAGTGPLFDEDPTPPDAALVTGLISFAALYFLLNSWLVAGAIALDQKLNAFEVWSKHFFRLSLNYWAGASVAACLVSFTHRINPLSLFVIAPLMFVLFFTYKWSTERVEKAETHLAEMKRTFLQTIEALALAIDAKDQVTHGHIRRVQRYTMALANALGIQDENQLDALRAAALLHDTGKLAVPEYILNKPGPLTASEFERMKVHAAVGADILKNIDFPYPVEPIVRYHHEAWDGSGYPEGLRGSEIPLGARILSVVDCYDAVTSDRPYRPRMTRQQAEAVLRDRRGKTYDPWVVDNFLRLLDKLEQMEAAERLKGPGADPTLPHLAPAEFDVISATQAEDREFNELRRELPRAANMVEAADALFRHLRRIVPAASLALYRPRTDSTELEVVAGAGVGASAMSDTLVPIGERISGWIFAHAQPVMNSEATLELGPVARTFSVPLRFASGVPLLDGGPVAVLMVYSSEPFEKDHRRLLENAATLFVSSVSEPLGRTQARTSIPADRPANTAKSNVH
ncbi:MAG: HD domain-containing protein [Vicinamibacterales bacterium]